ncbi:LLM class flavin-dependent oxidoreductase [Roseovarius indicus]|uniref:LLM class flavin-dependent oxidoreductase n=1 Tax=Roseovarius indicus TaxID=540747 RepID=UPI000A60DB19|nr:LLM class flavin-dependent oxidoreductase [Roseovarius indicus]
MKDDLEGKGGADNLVVPGPDELRFDMLVTLSNINGTKSWPQLLNETRRRVQDLERLGFDAAWFGEHHFDIYSTDACPNPVMLATDLAARTKTLRLCMGAVTLTTWHPLRLAEDLAMLDHFSNGRLEVGFSRGIIPFEIVNINPDADRTKPEVSKAIFAENLEIIKRAWTQEKFDWDGERHQFPKPGIKYHPNPETPTLDGVTDSDGNWNKMMLVPRPLQEPTPPMWATSETIEGFVNAAEAGLGGITLFPNGRKLMKLLEAYQEARRCVTGVLPPLGANCALARKVFVAPTDEEARRIYKPIAEKRLEVYTKVRGLGVFLDEGEDENDPKFQNMSAFDLLFDRGHLFVGSPETVTNKIVEMSKEFGIRHWLFGGDADAAITSEDSQRSLEMMGNEVLPAAREALVNAE